MIDAQILADDQARIQLLWHFLLRWAKAEMAQELDDDAINAVFQVTPDDYAKIADICNQNGVMNLLFMVNNKNYSNNLFKSEDVKDLINKTKKFFRTEIK